MIIGTMRRDGTSGFTGSIRTLAFDAPIALVSAAYSDKENAPAWRLLVGDPALAAEIGAGWDRSGARGLYIALQIEDPSLAAPLRANMVRLSGDVDEYSILWSRPDPQGGH